MNTLQCSLRIAAGRVWHNMADAAQHRLFLNEETITESILLFLARRHRSSQLAIKVYTKQEEKKSGADWAWCFMDGGQSVAMRIQAKRLYGDAKYQALNPSGQQINQLISTADGHHPFYVFYNDALQGEIFRYSSSSSHFNCGSFRGPSHWGCMIARAQDVQQINSNTIAKLLPVSMPWHCLLCPILASSRNGVGRLTLPDIVAANLNVGSRYFGADERIEVKPTDPPAWVRFVQTAAETPSGTTADGIVPPPNRELEAYLENHNLAGVVLFTGDIEE
jgi:hypothetical protein